MWRMYCVCLLSVIVVLDLLGQSHVNRTSTHHCVFPPLTLSSSPMRSRLKKAWTSGQTIWYCSMEGLASQMG